MDYEPNEDQRAILDAVGQLLERQAGPARAIELARAGAYDDELDAALVDAGFADITLAEGTGALEATMLVEAIARAAGVVAYGAGALVAPAVLGERPRGPVALVSAFADGPVRFAAHATTLIACDGASVRVVTLGRGDCEPVRSNFGYPMGRLRPDSVRRAPPLEGVDAERVRDWWRVALAAETAGTMRACLEVTVEYLKQRRQFGRTIGSFQAVQHRLAECAVGIEAARWLAFEAAWLGAPAEQAAVAATHALAAASHVFREMHQLSGAIGFTHEHDLHVWSMRLHALRLELGGVAAHARAAAGVRWSG